MSRLIGIAAALLVVACGVKGAPRAPRPAPAPPPAAPAAEILPAKTEPVSPPPVEPAPAPGAAVDDGPDAGS